MDQTNLIYIILACCVIAGLAVALIFIFRKSDNKVAKWVVVGTDDFDTGPGNILWSSDGKTWEEYGPNSAMFTIRGEGVAYGTTNGTNPLWVAVGYNLGGKSDGNILHSSDGKTWTVSDSTGASFSSVGKGVAYGTADGINPLWVAVGDDVTANGHILHSSDGKKWYVSDSASFKHAGYGVAYGTSNGNDHLWVAVGDDDPGVDKAKGIMYSSDGKTWTQSDSTGASFQQRGHGVAYGTSDGTNQLWVAVGNNYWGGNPFGNILYSEDGKTWTVSDSSGAFFNSYATEVAYGTSDGKNQLWVAVGTSSAGDKIDGNENILWSNNGKKWYESSGASFKHYANGIAYGLYKGKPFWVAGGNSPGKSNGNENILWSNNGKHWYESSGEPFLDAGFVVAADHFLYGMNPSFYH